MGRKVQAFPIDGSTYTFTQLGAVEGKDLFHEIRKIALPALRGLLGGGLLKEAVADGKLDIEKLEGENLGALVGLVLTAVETMPKKLEQDVCAAFARTCTVSNPETSGLPVALGDSTIPGGMFDDHFSGQMGTYQKWLIAGLKFNFASFLGASAS